MYFSCRSTRRRGMRSSRPGRNPRCGPMATETTSTCTPVERARYQRHSWHETVQRRCQGCARPQRARAPGPWRVLCRICCPKKVVAACSQSLTAGQTRGPLARLQASSRFLSIESVCLVVCVLTPSRLTPQLCEEDTSQLKTRAHSLVQLYWFKTVLKRVQPALRTASRFGSVRLLERSTESTKTWI